MNPRAGASWSGNTSAAGESVYASAKPTKFGILEEQLDNAIRIARTHALVIDTVHAHVGDGFLTDALQQLDVAIERLAGFVVRLRGAGFPIAEVNAGGGLGVPQREEDEPLDPDAYAAVLARHLGALGVTVACEPGDFLAKEMGVLLAEVVTVDERDDLWAEDLPFPEVHEGDIVAVLGVGTYNQSMHLDHCLRPPASVVAFADRSGAPVR